MGSGVKDAWIACVNSVKGKCLQSWWQSVFLRYHNKVLYQQWCWPGIVSAFRCFSCRDTQENNWSMSSWVCPTGRNPSFTYMLWYMEHRVYDLCNMNCTQSHTFLKMPNSTSRAANVSVYLFLLSLQVLSIWIYKTGGRWSCKRTNTCDINASMHSKGFTNLIFLSLCSQVPVIVLTIEALSQTQSVWRDVLNKLR